MVSESEFEAQRFRPGQFDRTAVRVNQAAIVVVLIAAFLGNLAWLVALLAVVLALGAIDGRLALFQGLYRGILRPAGLLRPDLRTESAAPHRFAQGVGATVLVASSATLFGGLGSLGWALALLVVVLAAINLVFGFCAGCFLYLQISRLRRAR